MGWEGVGLCSYLGWIGFWYKDLANAQRRPTRPSSSIESATGGFRSGIFLLFALLASSSGAIAGRSIPSATTRGCCRRFKLALKANPGVAETIAMSFFVGAAGKSAQFPLYLWLPDAMAGPERIYGFRSDPMPPPMVTSGVEKSNAAEPAFTSCSKFAPLWPVLDHLRDPARSLRPSFAALIAFGQADIKEGAGVHSTVSQLGYMFMCRLRRGESTGPARFHVTYPHVL